LAAKSAALESRRAAAVALKKYGIEESTLPRIVAAGYGKLAEQIVELAFKNGVKVREDAVLAQMLAAIEIDSDIPTEALVAVAEILAYVYQANGDYPLAQKSNKVSGGDGGDAVAGERQPGKGPHDDNGRT